MTTKNTQSYELRICSRAPGPLLALVLGALALTTHASAQDMGQAVAYVAGIPQIDARLPDKYSVATSQALPIDGVWMVTTIRKKIRIEQGRAYATDPWLHMFTLKGQPDRVVLRNFQRTGPGKYTADDLPLMGPATITLKADGNLDVVVKGALWPTRYRLRRLEFQYPEAFSAELASAP